MKNWKRILLWSGAALTVLVLAAALTVWLARDWPRRQVASALADAFAADIDLARLEIRDSETVILHGLAVRDSRYYPWVESLQAERVVVSAALGEALQARYRTIRVEEGRAVVRETNRPAEERGADGAVQVGLIELPDTTLVVRGDKGETTFSIEGRITGLGSTLGGDLRLTGDTLHLVPLLSFLLGSELAADLEEDLALDLRHPVSGAEASVQLGTEDAALRFTAGAGGGISYKQAERAALPFPGIDVQLAEDPAGEWRYSGAFEVAGTTSVRVEGAMAADGGAPQLARLDLESGDPARLLFTLGMLHEDIVAEGRLSLMLASTGEDRYTCRVAARAEQLALPRGEPAAPGMGIDLAPLCPLALEYDGALGSDDDAGDWHTAGRALLTSATAGTLTVDGSLRFGGPANSVDAGWKWSGREAADLRRLAARFGIDLPKEYLIAGTVRAVGQVRGALDRPQISGTAAVDRFGFCLEGEGASACALQLSAGVLNAAFSWREGSDPRFPSISLDGDLTLGPLEPLPLSLAAVARLRRGWDAGTFENLSATVGGVARCSGSGGWEPGTARPFNASLRIEEATLPALRRALEPLTGDVLPGYGLEAPVSGDLVAALDGEGSWAVTGTLDTGELWLSSEDGANAVQGAAAAWRVSLQTGPGGDFSAEAATEAGGFQLLWGPVFGDFGEHRTGIGISAGLDGGEGRWWAEARVRPAEGVELNAALSGGDGDGVRYQGDLRVTDLAGAFETCARRPLGGSFPVLEQIAAAGAIEAEAMGNVTGARATLQGRVRLSGLDFTGVEQTMTVHGLALDLPLDLAWGPPGEDGSRPVSGPPLTGRVGFDQVRLDRLTFGATDSGLAVHGDTVSLEEAQTIPLLGGAVTLHRLTLAGLLGEGRRLETGITIDGLQLAELSRALEWPRFEGEADGYLPRVTLSPSRLRVEGGGELSLFGGVVRISDISGEEVLSRYPRLAFSAEWSDIDLARATRTFDVGEVTGILEGRVEDLHLFAGTPVAFRAELRTVPRKGVPQTINVKAINNLAIVGTGGRITVFDRGIHSLLDRYTYEQLGVQMRLDRDQFYLRGTEERGGKELFLKGRLPFRIDVVNAQPGKTVSFSTMLARLQSIDFATAVTGSGPAASPSR